MVVCIYPFITDCIPDDKWIISSDFFTNTSVYNSYYRLLTCEDFKERYAVNEAHWSADVSACNG